MFRRTGILAIGAGSLVLVAGCALQASPVPVTPASSPPPSEAVVPSGPPPTPVASSPRVGDGTIDPATFLQVCALPPEGSEGIAIECGRLVQAALRGLPPGDPVTRIDTSYTCATACKPFDPDHGYAIVTAGTGTVEVDVARQPDGTFAVVGSTSFDPPAPSPFEAPAPSAPAAEGAPSSVNERAPLPQCGVETGSAYDTPDTKGRQCFWDGVLAGSPVEFMTVHPDTEGLLTTTIYRYSGSGGVAVIHNDEGGWWL